MKNPWLKTKIHQVFLMSVDTTLEMTKRQYPRSVIERVIQDMQGYMARGLMGHLDHQADSMIHLAQVSHEVTDLRLVGNELWATVVIMETPNGRILEMLMREHPEDVVFATAGVGNGRVNDEGVLVIGDNYKLITVNAVPKDGSGKFNTCLREYNILQER